MADLCHPEPSWLSRAQSSGMSHEGSFLCETLRIPWLVQMLHRGSPAGQAFLISSFPSRLSAFFSAVALAPRCTGVLTWAGGWWHPLWPEPSGSPGIVFDSSLCLSWVL